MSNSIVSIANRTVFNAVIADNYFQAYANEFERIWHLCESQTTQDLSRRKNCVCWHSFAQGKAELNWAYVQSANRINECR